MTFIVLPIIPDEGIGPFGGLNPRQVWMIAIVLAGVSFVGYVLVKYFGAGHGVLLAAAAGGLVSSTAVTAAYARRAAAGEGAPRLLAAGVSLANAVSFARVIVLIAVLNPVLLLATAPPLIAATLVAGGLAVAAVYWRRNPADEQKAVEFRNPFGVWSVIGFALLLGAIIVVGRVLGQRAGATGAIIGAAAMGLADVDAVTVAMARLAPRTPRHAERQSRHPGGGRRNMAAKLAIGAGIGRGRFAVELAVMSAAPLVAAALAAWATFVVTR